LVASRPVADGLYKNPLDALTCRRREDPSALHFAADALWETREKLLLEIAIINELLSRPQGTDLHSGELPVGKSELPSLNVTESVQEHAADGWNRGAVDRSVTHTLRFIWHDSVSNEDVSDPLRLLILPQRNPHHDKCARLPRSDRRRRGQDSRVAPDGAHPAHGDSRGVCAETTNEVGLPGVVHAQHVRAAG